MMKKNLKFIIPAFLCLVFINGCASEHSTDSTKSVNKAMMNANSNPAANAVVANINAPAAANSNSGIIVSSAGNTNYANSSVDPKEPIGKFNLPNFNRLETGMTHDQAAKILGSKGESSGETQNGASKMEMYKWSDATGSFIKVIFIDGKLSDKVQTGLR